MAYDDNMKGVLFKAKERKHEKSPEYTGNVVIGGVKYRIAAWVNTSRDGQKYFGIRVSEPDSADQREGTQAGADRQQGGHAPYDPSDEIPFAPEWR